MSATLAEKIVEKITPDANERHDNGRRYEPPKKRHLLRWGLLSAAAFVIVLAVLLGLIQKLLWMRELDYVGIFWTLLSVKWGMFVVALVFAFLYLWINARFAAKRIDLSPSKVPPLRVTTVSPAGKVLAAADALRGISTDLSPKLLMWASGVAVMFVSLMFAAAVSSQWDTYLRFRYGGSFGLSDPLYGVDLGFYLFRLPFYELLQGNLTFLTVGALAILGLFGVLGLRQFKPGQQFTIADNTARHLDHSPFHFGWQFRVGLLSGSLRTRLFDARRGLRSRLRRGSRNSGRFLDDARRFRRGLCPPCSCLPPSTN
jgi:hypothetical protein